MTGRGTASRRTLSRHSAWGDPKLMKKAPADYSKGGFFVGADE